MLLGVKPKDHGIPTRAINDMAFDYPEESTENWGIPAMSFDRWHRLLGGAEDVQDDYGELEWPETGSTNLTKSPYPGDDAITVQWLITELTAKGNVSPDGQVTNPDDGTPFTDDTLRQHLKYWRKEWFDFPGVIAEIELGPDDDGEDDG